MNAQHHPEREVFERFFQAWPREWSEERFKLDSTGGYRDVDTHNAWSAWAERAAIASAALSHTVVSYADLRRAEKGCDASTPVVSNMGFLLALRKGVDSRDQFAKVALHALMAEPGLSEIYEGIETAAEDADLKFEVALNAYSWAEAMLRAREAS